MDRVDLVGAFSLGNAARVAINGIRHVSSSRFASQGVRFHLGVKLSSRRWPHLNSLGFMDTGLGFRTVQNATRLPRFGTLASN